MVPVPSIFSIIKKMSSSPRPDPLNPLLALIVRETLRLASQATSVLKVRFSAPQVLKPTGSRRTSSRWRGDPAGPGDFKGRVPIRP